MDEEGMVTLSSVQSVLTFNNKILDVTYDEFWGAMTYFLNRVNSSRRKK